MAIDMVALAHSLGGKQLEYKKGAQLAVPGDTVQYGLVIAQGTARQYDIRSNGTEVTLNIYRSGSLLTLPWILAKDVSVNFIECTEDCKVIAVPLKVLQQEFSSNHELALEMLTRLSRGIDGIFSRLTAHGTNDASFRIMTELTIEAMRFGTEMKNGRYVAIRPSVVAERTGMARETVSRHLKKLIDTKQLEIYKNGYIIINR